MDFHMRVTKNALSPLCVSSAEATYTIERESPLEFLVSSRLGR